MLDRALRAYNSAEPERLHVWTPSTFGAEAWRVLPTVAHRPKGAIPIMGYDGDEMEAIPGPFVHTSAKKQSGEPAKIPNLEYLSRPTRDV